MEYKWKMRNNTTLMKGISMKTKKNAKIVATVLWLFFIGAFQPIGNTLGFHMDIYQNVDTFYLKQNETK